MYRCTPIAVIAMLAAGCNGDNGPNEVAPSGNTSTASPPVPETAGAPALRWALQSSREGTALVLVSDPATTAVRLFCPSTGGRLLVNVPGFRAIGSEERMSFGSGGNVAALVADARGHAGRGGVTATGAVPDGLEALIGGPVSVSYGAQTSGPHAAPPVDLVRAFAAACRDQATPAEREASAPSASVHPCLMQGSDRLAAARVRAVGTEPFWGARIEGRCVTYSHPEDQSGTRVWTRYAAAPGGGTWTGALGGRKFELRLRAQPGCSDGMSDRRYPLAAELLVNGERRRGCAEPA